ncbi:uncharacterized protein RAG0_01400 [Rhynchosporium agropyri]|uniref:Uncharacterized protein n=1 Tax=Rhynchosporium agropyri TaxID=914238 RepID=A0A1E1JWH8_9HELO|nr:uncharacterized protein RAG0_01400 [Rhynchosporium agropyri]
MFGNYALAALAALTSGVLANTPIDNSVFVNDPLSAVKAAAPLWHFDAMTCFPTAATQADGSQTRNLTADLYIRTNTEQDTGHPYDWEWAAVKFVKNAQGQYIRDGIWLEQDGNRPYISWGKIPNTFDCKTDRAQNGNTNRNHPKAYFGKWKHHVDVHFNDKFENDCFGAVLNSTDYHSDDYASDNLVLGSAVPAIYKYGKADSTPSSSRLVERMIFVADETCAEIEFETSFPGKCHFDREMRRDSSSSKSRTQSLHPWFLALLIENRFRVICWFPALLLSQLPSLGALSAASRPRLSTSEIVKEFQDHEMIHELMNLHD